MNSANDKLLLLYETRQNDLSTALTKLEQAVTVVSKEMAFPENGEPSLALLNGM
jgi:hypothetical protein